MCEKEIEAIQTKEDLDSKGQEILEMLDEKKALPKSDPHILLALVKKASSLMGSKHFIPIIKVRVQRL